MRCTTLFAIVCLCAATQVFAQGQDSQPADRDLQVIATLLAGGFDNANQNYFDQRGKRDVKHRRIHLKIDAVPTVGEMPMFTASGYWDNDPDTSMGRYVFTLEPHYATSSVRMRVWSTGETSDASRDNDSACSLFWRRDAEQFTATSDGPCAEPMFSSMVISEKHLWVTMANAEAGDYRLRRVRNFECYADIPGVGGGRDEPYERYDGFRIHDQGGAVWFDTKDGRRLGISLLLVDWPINNYEGIFTRDSFVIYVSEEDDDKTWEHGYAFTVPEADRVGINLKWMLASCFMKSNKFATPYM
ncbi:MAG: hypothetical protein AAF004_05070 [Pseudomonadota bacterium]